MVNLTICPTMIETELGMYVLSLLSIAVIEPAGVAGQVTATTVAGTGGASGGASGAASARGAASVGGRAASDVEPGASGCGGSVFEVEPLHAASAASRASVMRTRMDVLDVTARIGR